MSIEDRIASVGDRLTPTERRIAEAVLDDPTLLAFGTVSDLADRVRTSRPSIVRFASKLGFEGYTDLQQWVREGVAQQLATPSQRVRQPSAEFESVHRSIEESVQRTLGCLGSDRLGKLAAPLVSARKTWILSGETSRAGAVVLQSGLSMVLDHVRLIEDHDVGRDLSRAAEGDAAVVFDFARYRRVTVQAARAMADLGVELVAVTDGPLSPLATMTEHWCELDVRAVGPFDSSLPAVMAAELLVLEVVRQLGPRAKLRLDRLERLWDITGTFLEPGD